MQEVYRKILLNLQSGRHQEAERQCLFELGSRQSPDARLLFYLGTAARMLNKPQAARVAFDAALEMEPDNPEFLQACASTCEANKDYAGALRLMQRAVELVPNDAQALANLAIALERAGRPLEALPLYQRVLGGAGQPGRQPESRRLVAQVGPQARGPCAESTGPCAFTRVGRYAL